MESGVFRSLRSGQVFIIDSGGIGVPFVLIHGLGGSHTNWVELFDPLAERARTIAIDLPGFGYSPPLKRHDLASLARSVIELLESLGERSVLIANSMGGLVAEMVAEARPELIEDLVLICPASPAPASTKPANPQVAARVFTQSIPGLGHAITGIIRRTSPPEKRARALLDVVAADSSQLSERIVTASLAMAERRSQLPWTTRVLVESTASIRRMYLPKRNFIAMIEAIDMEALVLSGARDQVVAPEAIDALQALRPDWTFKRHPDLGHVPQMENAAWVFTEVESWLTRDRSPASSMIRGVTETAGA